jgi:hypothetical protein
MCYIYIYLFYVRLPDDDLKKIEICRRIGALYVEVCILILVHLLLLSVLKNNQL